MLRRKSSLLAFCAAAAVLGFATPAHADSGISINPGNVPTLAADFEQECGTNFGGGPYAGQDVWVFNLPGEHGTTGDFLSVTAVFSTPGGSVTKTIPTDGGAIVLDSGTSKAWIITPAGWTLTDATAVISGTAERFVLTHTCVSTPNSPSPSASTSTSASPPASASASTSTSGSPSAGVSGSSTPGTSGNPSTSPASGNLPLTGTAVTGLVSAAAVFIAAGAGLVLLQRRRKVEDAG